MAEKKDKGSVDLGVLEMTPLVCDPEPAAKLDTKPAAKKVKADEKSEPEKAAVLELGFHFLYPGVKTPGFATEASGCFDLETYLGDALTSIKYYNSNNQEGQLKIREDADGSRYVLLNPGDRALLPTGLVFDIPNGFALHVLPRSSAGVKKGLGMPHSLGYIDEDYVHECFVAVKNESTTKVRVDHKERVAQATLVRYFHPSFKFLQDAPTQKTSRNGGVGSTNR